MSQEDQSYGILSASRALLGAVTANLRAVTIHIDPSKKLVKVRFFYDGLISDEDFDTANTAMTEIISDFTEDYDLDDGVVRLDHPKKIPTEGILAFHRKE
ncbi:MAG: hypothetical protein SP4CHLAM17_12830 [Chlamydiales bacterium]|nr:hypothetical protein [Chlamydiales bacterium]